MIGQKLPGVFLHTKPFFSCSFFSLPETSDAAGTVRVATPATYQCYAPACQCNDLGGTASAMALRVIG